MLNVMRCVNVYARVDLSAPAAQPWHYVFRKPFKTAHKYLGFLRCPLLIPSISAIHCCSQFFSTPLCFQQDNTNQDKCGRDGRVSSSPPFYSSISATQEDSGHQPVSGVPVWNLNSPPEILLSIWEQCFANHFWSFNFDSFGVYFPSMGKTSKHLLPGLICRLNAEHGR